MDKEKYYGEHLAPKIHALAEECNAAGLSFLAVCEWAPGELERTLCIHPESSLGFRFADAAAQANGNVDSLFLDISLHARKHGHSSFFLSKLGIPSVPAPNIAG